MFSTDDFIGTHGHAENLFLLLELFLCTACHTLQVTKQTNNQLSFSLMNLFGDAHDILYYSA